MIPIPAMPSHQNQWIAESDRTQPHRQKRAAAATLLPRQTEAKVAGIARLVPQQTGITSFCPKTATGYTRRRVSCYLSPINPYQASPELIFDEKYLKLNFWA